MTLRLARGLNIVSVPHRGQGGGGAIANLYTYDTSIGNGVGSDGFASLPLHSGAKYIYVNSSTGSDTNSGLTNALPVATLAHALTKATVGAGDQILVAEGTTYSEGIPDWRSGVTPVNGLSAQYPIVTQSYDPADPTNTAKYGRATGSNRPVFTAAGSTFMNGHGPFQFIAFRGLDFNPGNVANASINAINAVGSGEYLLFENCRFQYMMVNLQGIPFYKAVFRNCSAHGQWENSGSGDEQWIFIHQVDGLTVEDCSCWHAGWKEGANRTDSASLGGATGLSHPIYVQDTCPNTNVVRRCVFIDCAADGSRMKGGGLYQNNLVLNCPIAVDNGGGNEYSVSAPLGVFIDIAGNAAFGMSGIDGSAGGWGWAIDGNARPGSMIRNSLAARSNGGTGNAYVIKSQPDVNYDVYSYPTNVIVNSNVSYLVSASGSSFQIANLGATTTVTSSNNVWDDPASGTNVNVGSATFANTYTLTSLLAEINPAYTDLTTAKTDWINNPDQRGWRTGAGLARLGYAVPADALSDLVTTMSVTVGIPSNGLLVGTLDGTSLTPSGLGTGFRVDSDGRCWRYDGSGTATSGSCTITESDGVNSHTTTIPFNVYARPVLSSLSVTPSSTSATATVSTNVGSGSLYWVVSTSSVAPDWTLLRNGFDTTGTSSVKAHGTQAVSVSGSQSITGISGLVASTGYYLHVAQLDGNLNPSVTSTDAFTTTASGPPATNVALDFSNLAMSNLYTDTAHTTNVTADGQTVKAIKDPTSGIIATNSTGWVYHANSGHPYLQMDGTSTFTVSSFTFADVTGQYGIWITANVTGTTSLLTSSSGGTLIKVTTSNGAVNFNIRSSSAQLASSGSFGGSANTDQVYSGLSKGTSGTSGTIEAFVNNVDTPGTGAVAWSGTPLATDSFLINPPTASSGRFYKLVIAKGDQTANQTAMQTYMQP